ncbi:MAG TPA: pitrilysin family protein [Albitalea sp.]|nr:pitrilysin family protein [Albitalea sp.]
MMPRALKAIRWAALAGSALLGASLHAQPYETPPKPVEPRPLTISPPTEHSLPNGLRVVVAERRGVPLVTARLMLLTGSEADPERRAGLASMTAGLLTRGTTRHSAPALVNAAESLGGSLDSGAGWHQTSVGITVTTPQLHAALTLVSEVVREPAFAPAEIERYRTQALDAMKVAYAEPGTVAAMVAQRALYGAGAYGHPVDGTPGSLPRIARADIVKLHAQAYRPDNAVLVLAGDIDLDGAVKLARQHFGAWKRPAEPLPVPSGFSGTAWAEPLTVVDMPGAGQAGVVLVLPAMPASSPERTAASVTNAVLGRGYSSRLNQEIRIKRGLSYGASSGLDLRRETGTLHVSVSTKNASAAEVLGLIGTELDQLARTPVPPDELVARKATLIGDFSRMLETTSGLAGQTAALVVAGLPVADLPRRIQRIEAITPAQVQDFAARYFDAARRRVVIAGVAAEFEPALKAQAPELRRLALPQLDLDAPSGAAR